MSADDQTKASVALKGRNKPPGKSQVITPVQEVASCAEVSAARHRRDLVASLIESRQDGSDLAIQIPSLTVEDSHDADLSWLERLKDKQGQKLPGENPSPLYGVNPQGGHRVSRHQHTDVLLRDHAKHYSAKWTSLCVVGREPISPFADMIVLLEHPNQHLELKLEPEDAYSNHDVACSFSPNCDK